MIKKKYNLNTMADNIGKTVMLLPLEKMKGKINGLYINDAGPEYQIAYFMNGDRKTCYFNEDEIEFQE